MTKEGAKLFTVTQLIACAQRCVCGRLATRQEPFGLHLCDDEKCVCGAETIEFADAATVREVQAILDRVQ